MTETDQERKARTGLSSLQIADAEAAAVQKTPNRIGLDQIEAAIASVQFMYPDNIPGMTICTIKLKNGYGLVGKSAVADIENYDKEIGQKFAREDAIRSAWPLFAFALRERLSPCNGGELEDEGMTEGQREAAADITGNRNRL